MITITRHEIVKQGSTDKGLIVGVTYKDAVTGREVYRDVRFPINGFPTNPPPKADITGKVRAWLVAVPGGGKSILQTMKDEASIVPEISEQAGIADSLIGEPVQE